MLRSLFRRLTLSASLVVLLSVSLLSALPTQAKGLAKSLTPYTVAVNVTAPSGTIGASTYMDIWHPTVYPGDQESLAQIAVIQTQLYQGRPTLWRDIEEGWLVDPDPSVYGGGTDPHLFVYVRDVPKYGGSSGCLVQQDASSPTGWSCGFVPLDTTNYPGKSLMSEVGNVRTFYIAYSGGNWLIHYDANYIGYIPESAFSGSFNSVSVAEWQGEVAVAKNPPATQMGNGNCGTSTSPQNVPAHFYTMAIETATQSYPAYTYSQKAEVTNKKFYNGAYNYTKNTLTTLAYGGPTGCP